MAAGSQYQARPCKCDENPGQGSSQILAHLFFVHQMFKIIQIVFVVLALQFWMAFFFLKCHYIFQLFTFITVICALDLPNNINKVISALWEVNCCLGDGKLDDKLDMVG